MHLNSCASCILFTCCLIALNSKHTHTYLTTNIPNLHCRTRNNVRQPDNFCLNIVFVSINIAVNRRSGCTNGSKSAVAINLWHMYSMLKCGYKLCSKSFSGGVAPTEQCKPLDHWQTWVYIAANSLRNALTVMPLH